MKKLTLLLCSAAILLSQPVLAKHDNDKPLPPGLQKKLAKGGTLPPGWQKKLSVGQVLQDDYYRRAVVVRKPAADGIVTVQIEGTIIELFEHSREIVRILEGRR